MACWRRPGGAVSRTDKTKPWRVRVAEHRTWAEHHHEDGICDLPPSPRDLPEPWDGVRHCRWMDWNIANSDVCCGGCGCRMCTGYYWRREDRRFRRHEARREIRRVLNESDFEGCDLPPLPSRW